MTANDKGVDFEMMSDRCIAAGEAVMKVGSPDLQVAMRIVLAVLGREIAAGLSGTIPGRVSRAHARRYLN